MNQFNTLHLPIKTYPSCLEGQGHEREPRVSSVLCPMKPKEVTDMVGTPRLAVEAGKTCILNELMLLSHNHIRTHASYNL